MEKTPIIRALVWRKVKESKDGNKFPSFTVKVLIIIKGEEDKGPQPKWITAKFDKSIKTDEIRGLAWVYFPADACQKPRLYDVIEVDGKKKYPYAFFSAIDHIEPVKTIVKQSEFASDDQDVEE